MNAKYIMKYETTNSMFRSASSITLLLTWISNNLSLTEGNSKIPNTKGTVRKYNIQIKVPDIYRSCVKFKIYKCIICNRLIQNTMYAHTDVLV